MGTRTKILVRGIVQGVGFRPYIYSLAKKSELLGNVSNNGEGVLIRVEGNPKNIDRFIAELEENPPPLSSIDSIARDDDLDIQSFHDFRILSSNQNGAKFTPISADISTCSDCLRELFDPNNRRYLYPFINCTNCGPRFTVIEDVPYDRERTTMRNFLMCAECREEYENPHDRRFHAEPIACAKCGPRLFLKDGNGNDIQSKDIIDRTRKFLDEGRIVAVKGLGGYHLVCDALNADAVATLRRRKYREDKPFALMASSISVIARYCDVSGSDIELLNSRYRPIVLMPKRLGHELPDAVAPGLSTLGFMLPYTPLHFLLFNGLDRPLVMTSGNISDEPICFDDSEARVRLGNVADYFLFNDRRIFVRTDDSIVRTDENGHYMTVRRSRGFAPAPIKTPFHFDKQILACGAELKNTFCLAKDKYAFLSHHIGDLENLETLKSFTDGIEHFKRLFEVEPQIIAYDLHPEYLSTKYAHSCRDVETKIGVQHHHAHIASCLVDNGAAGEVIGVAMDGLGFGTDGRLWGGEFFVADLERAERVAHLDYVPMPGGSMAIREPWRMAAVYLQKTFKDEFLDLRIPFVNDLKVKKWTTLKSMIAADTNCPGTSSMGRLFDAVSALLCLRSTVNYEGQAAIILENIADKRIDQNYRFEKENGGIIKAERVMQAAVADLIAGVEPGVISARFHLAVAHLIADIAIDVRDERKVDRVALSGGVFQNMFLLESTAKLLHHYGFEVLTHHRVPTNDGGLSLGQAAVANARIRSGRI